MQTTYFRYPGGETSRIQYPNGTIIRHEYTARGQLKSVQNGSQQPFVSYTYFEDGKVNQETYLNGVQSTFAYDGRGMISSITHQKSGQNLALRQYFRDNRDRITAWKRGTNTSQNPMEDGRGDRFSYDDEGQLKTAVYRALTPEGTPSGAMRSDSFQYDELGNRMLANQVASRGLMHMARRDNGLNEYFSWENDYLPPDQRHWGSGIFYDDNFGSPWVAPGNGVTMGDGYITASYNALNQPVAMWSMYYQGTSYFVWFGYDPLGRCVKRWTADGSASTPGYNPATYFYFDGWNLVQEGPDHSTMARLYVHGNRVDEIVASEVDGYWYYHQYDASGNCILLTTPVGGLQEQYDYDAFGYPYFYTATGTRLGTLHTRFLFTGREWLNDLRIYDFRNRMYQPELGRFLQPDPKEFGAGDYNLYRYCHNDPVNHSDPTGLDPGDPFGSAVEAVRDLHSFINPTSIHENREYGSTIYKLDGKYYATAPLGGTADHSYARGPTPDGAKTVGDYHTHGDYSYKDPKTGEITRAAAPGHGLTGAKHDNQKSDHFSPKDKTFYGKSEYKGYLGTPSGRPLMIDPNDKKQIEHDISK